MSVVVRARAAVVSTTASAGGDATADADTGDGETGDDDATDDDDGRSGE